MDIFEIIGALVLGLIFGSIVLYVGTFGLLSFWEIIGKITKPLTPLFDYYLKLRIRKYALYYIIEMIIAYILVMIPFVLFAGLGVLILGSLFNI